MTTTFARARAAGLLVCVFLAAAAVAAQDIPTRPIVPDPSQPQLVYLTAISVPAVDKFVAADAFGEKNPAGIHFTLNELFKMHFLDDVEEKVPPMMLAVNRLQKAALDAPIIKALGERSEVTLVRVFQLLSKQPKGEDGPLLTDNNANMFYVRDSMKNLWVIDAYWLPPNGWYVDASSVNYPVEWYGGDLVFSPK
jgi:hypothetical protein